MPNLLNDQVLIQQFLEYHLREQCREVTSNQCEHSRGRGDRKRTDRDNRDRGFGRHEKRDQDHMTPQDKARAMLQKVEANKAQMLQVLSGKQLNLFLGELNNDADEHEVNKMQKGGLYHSVVVDESYALIENHIDEATKRKIVLGEFVDLARLLPKDKVVIQQDTRMEMVNRNGMLYFVPMSEHDMVSINSYGRWEQVCRVYSTIYVEEHPYKAKELIQYNHVIYTASLTFMWDNVYAYDIDFRMHMSKFPDRNWGIILHQAWTMRLKDRVKFSGAGNAGTMSNNGQGSSSRKKVVLEI